MCCRLQLPSSLVDIGCTLPDALPPQRGLTKALIDSAQLRAAAKAARVAACADKASWLAERGLDIVADLQRSNSGSLWGLARQLCTKQKGPRPLAVVKLPDGSVASTADQVAAA